MNSSTTFGCLFAIILSGVHKVHQRIHIIFFSPERIENRIRNENKYGYVFRNNFNLFNTSNEHIFLLWGRPVEEVSKYITQASKIRLTIAVCGKL